jgi:hypothetical protein
MVPLLETVPVSVATCPDSFVIPDRTPPDWVIDRSIGALVWPPPV